MIYARTHAKTGKRLIFIGMKPELLRVIAQGVPVRVRSEDVKGAKVIIPEGWEMCFMCCRSRKEMSQAMAQCGVLAEHSEVVPVERVGGGTAVPSPCAGCLLGPALVRHHN